MHECIRLSVPAPLDADWGRDYGLSIIAGQAPI